LFRRVIAIFLSRLLAAVPMLVAVSAVVFVILRALPADPVAMMLPPGGTLADAAMLRAKFGLDLPLLVQYWLWLRHAVVGDLGESIFFRVPVSGLLAQALPATAELSLVSLALALMLSVPGGLLCYAQKTRVGRMLADSTIVTLLSVPSFLWAIFFILLVGVAFPILPFSGRVGGNTMLPNLTGFLLFDFLIAGRLRDWIDAAAHLVLPASALALSFAPSVVRVLRSGLIDAAHDDYVTFGRQRGLSERRILLNHMLRNAALPTVTLIGVQFGFLFGGTLLVELIFSFPGLGSLTVQAVRNHDLPLIQGAALVYCVVVLLINAIVDSLYVVLNPRLAQLV
jgi:ABC-type dipeptide/oligopeptide/nickel transport system permease component